MACSKAAQGSTCVETIVGLKDRPPVKAEGCVVGLVHPVSCIRCAGEAAGS